MHVWMVFKHFDPRAGHGFRPALMIGLYYTEDQATMAVFEQIPEEYWPQIEWSRFGQGWSAEMVIKFESSEASALNSFRNTMIFSLEPKPVKGDPTESPELRDICFGVVRAPAHE